MEACKAHLRKPPKKGTGKWSASAEVSEAEGVQDPQDGDAETPDEGDQMDAGEGSSKNQGQFGQSPARYNSQWEGSNRRYRYG